MYVQRQLNLTDNQVQDFFEVAQYHIWLGLFMRN
jgi:hypothetical protein